MPKLEFTPVNDWQRFNLLGKRLFDYANSKTNIITGVYIGDGIHDRIIKTDLMPKIIIIFNITDDASPVIWLDVMLTKSRMFDGTILIDGIMGLTPKKDGFIIGDSTYVNDPMFSFYYAVLG